MRRKLTLASAVLGLALHVPAWALGLGQLEQRSALNEPLSARIPLTSVSLDERETMTVSLASAEAYRRAGVERPFFLASLDFEVVDADGAQPYIRVSTQRPVREPFLNFLLEVSWNSGRMVRQYTLLLDPPVYSERRQTPAAATTPARGSASRAAQPATTRAPAASDTGSTRAAANRNRRVAEVPADEGGEYRVQSNDTLWGIARDVRPNDSVSVHQTMVALFEENPRAFINQDMNRLRRGAILRVPSAERIAVGREQAQQVVSEHVSRWRASQQQNAAASGAERDGGPSGQSQASAPGQARLEIIAPQADERARGDAGLLDQALAPNEDNLRRLQNQLGLAQEQSASLESENSELESQVSALRTEVARLERLVELQMAQGVGQPGSSVSAEGAADPVAEASASTPAEPAAEQEQPVAGTEPGEAEQAPPQTAATQPAAQPAPPEQPAAPPSIWQDTRIMGILGAAIVALLGLAFMVLRRRRDDGEDSGVVELGEIHREEAPQAQPQAAAEQAQAGSDDEGDVLDGLEVYLAYGRYEQAREALEGAMQAEPARTDLRVKLLETLALMDDRGAFEAQAQALYGMLGDASHGEWQKVAEMGRAIAPENPLFADDSIEDDQPLVSEELAEPLFEQDDTGLGAEAAPAEESLESLDESFLASPAEPVAEEPAPAAEASPEAEAATNDSGLGDLEFDLSGFGDEAGETAVNAEPAAEAQAPSAAEDAAADSFELDFDLGTGGEAAAQSPAGSNAGEAVEESAPADAEAGEASFESALGGEDDTAFPSGDEMQTKLDLAQAYLDMGDADGAKELLTEVLDEAEGEHKQRAQAMLEQV
ncbi:FimV/HubP family polar landmark protein [Alkalilimnicola sp. S0819]|uniref:FimV/HubP family polar landmark protein n=1 Tax=Alkalilimnicola sp. S0819 TaxID=2613922 RepID=UPI0012622B18|nr:FimV/HubP family polar landmark protein [Alkalilimnicola sp. S0819]KAB7627857.1 FimV family protein [Alkalilimnicola sp. S0819]MPQ15491.1 hypothetical protein [Alkalilimnicola sp. S0819]